MKKLICSLMVWALGVSSVVSMTVATPKKTRERPKKPIVRPVDLRGAGKYYRSNH